MAKTFMNLTAGIPVTVEAFHGDRSITSRLMDMGIHPGVEVELINKMPLGGPFIIRVEASFLALRVEEAQCLIVKS